MFFNKLRALVSIFNSVGSVTVNGTQYHGKVVSIQPVAVFVDGVQVSEAIHQPITVIVAGDCESIDTMSGDVSAGNVTGNISTMSGDVNAGSTTRY